MSSITLTTVYECAGGDHLRINVTGDVADTIPVYYPDMLLPISDEDRQIFLKVLLRIAKITRSKNQIKNGLANGYTVTI
jgi:hypothetical protein